MPKGYLELYHSASLTNQLRKIYTFSICPPGWYAGYTPQFSEDKSWLCDIEITKAWHQCCGSIPMKTERVYRLAVMKAS